MGLAVELAAEPAAKPAFQLAVHLAARVVNRSVSFFDSSAGCGQLDPCSCSPSFSPYEKSSERHGWSDTWLAAKLCHGCFRCGGCYVSVHAAPSTLFFRSKFAYDLSQKTQDS